MESFEVRFILETSTEERLTDEDVVAWYIRQSLCHPGIGIRDMKVKKGIYANPTKQDPTKTSI